jgi:hypothetical protein
MLASYLKTVWRPARAGGSLLLFVINVGKMLSHVFRPELKALRHWQRTDFMANPMLTEATVLDACAR